jgi:hypothetical protein
LHSPQWQVASQLWLPLLHGPQVCVAFGAHGPEFAHEPHWQLALQVFLPQFWQSLVSLGAQAPSFWHWAQVQVAGSQVCEPQLPQGRVMLGVQPVSAWQAPHSPPESQVCVPLPQLPHARVEPGGVQVVHVPQVQVASQVWLPPAQS